VCVTPCGSRTTRCFGGMYRNAVLCSIYNSGRWTKSIQPVISNGSPRLKKRYIYNKNTVAARYCFIRRVLKDDREHSKLCLDTAANPGFYVKNIAYHVLFKFRFRLWRGVIKKFYNSACSVKCFTTLRVVHPVGCRI
jgi:hypothetical protein